MGALSTDERDDFVAHECVECGRDVPGSPDDVAITCSRCARDADYL